MTWAGPCATPWGREKDSPQRLLSSAKKRDCENETKARRKSRNPFARDGNRCQNCGRRFATSKLSLDYVVPRSRGGQATWGMIVCACLKCNVRKGGRTPREAGLELIRPPQEPRTSPALNSKLSHRKYKSSKTFLDHAY